MAAAASFAAAACMGPAPTPNVHVLHIENRTANAIMVSAGAHVLLQDDSTEFDSAVRPCGGKLDLIPGSNGIPADEWQVFLLRDPSGAFDASLGQWAGDPKDMPGHFDRMLIMWSRGDIPTSSLPRWVTITTSGVQLSATPPAEAGAAATPTACATLPPPQG
jgi:hypothetical protein